MEAGSGILIFTTIPYVNVLVDNVRTRSLLSPLLSLTLSLEVDVANAVLILQVRKQVQS